MIRGLSLSFLCFAGLGMSACSMFQTGPVYQPNQGGESAPAATAASDPWADVPVIEVSNVDTSGPGAIPEEGVIVVEDTSVTNGSAPVVSVSGSGGDVPTTITELEAPSLPEDIDTPALAPEDEAPAADEAPAVGDDAPVAAKVAVVETSSEAREAIQLGNQYYARGDLRLARTAYTLALDSTLSTTDEADLIKVLGAINAKLFTSSASTGDLKSYTVVKGDSLSKIAREHKTTFQFLRRINGLDSNLIRIGQELKVPRNQMSLVVRRDRKVADLMVGGDFVKRYAIGVGKDGRTPIGEFTILNRIEKPMDKDVPFGDPRHRLGTHWLGLEGSNGYEGYGIHGCRVDQYNEIGTECSEGCVRVTNEDAEEIHDLLPVGAKVIVKA